MGSHVNPLQQGFLYYTGLVASGSYCSSILASSLICNLHYLLRQLWLQLWLACDERMTLKRTEKPLK